MRTIAVLMTVHNRKDKTLKCLHHLFGQNLISNFQVDVYLTDDGCADGTPEAVNEQFPSVRIIRGDGGLYWNRGMYKAWQEAAKTKDYDFYMWLNDDTFIFPKAMSILLQTSREYDNQHIIVGTTSAINNAQSITYGGRIKKRGLIQPENRPIPCEYFNGNIVLFPRFVYNKVGMNDPFFHHALGDFDYGLRAEKLDIRSIIVPGIVGECDEHDNITSWSDPNVPFIKRWKAFRSPLGQNPEEFFIFELRHNSFIMACFHYLSNHIRVFFPKIWES